MEVAAAEDESLVGLDDAVFTLPKRALIGVGVMFFAMRVDYHFWKQAAVPILLGCLALPLIRPPHFLKAP